LIFDFLQRSKSKPQARAALLSISMREIKNRPKGNTKKRRISSNELMK